MSAAFGNPMRPAFDREEDQQAGHRHHPPLPRVSIQAFCETAEVQNALSEASADRRAARTHMTVQAGGVNAAVEFYTNAATPNVVIVELTSRGQAMLAELDRFAEICDPGTRVAVIGHTNDIQLYRELMQRGVSEYLVAPVSPLDVLGSLSNLFIAPDADPLGRVVTFVGAKGGVGSSTIAHNVAWWIAQEFENDVVITDLDLAFGTAGLDFNQDPPQGIAEAVYGGDRLDEVYLDRLLSKCTDHLSLMAAPSTLDREYDLQGDALEPVIDLIRKSVPVAIFDLPHVWTAWAKSTLLGSDEVVITAMPDLANLRNTKNIIDLLKQSRPNDRPPVLVLNQVGVAKKPEISAKDFAAALDLEPSAVIAFEPQLFATAANNGQMIAEMQAGAKPVEAFVQLAEIITGRAETRKPKKSPLAPLIERLKFGKS